MRTYCIAKEFQGAVEGSPLAHMITRFCGDVADGLEGDNIRDNEFQRVVSISAVPIDGHKFAGYTVYFLVEVT